MHILKYLSRALGFDWCGAVWNRSKEPVEVHMKTGKVSESLKDAGVKIEMMMSPWNTYLSAFFLALITSVYQLSIKAEAPNTQSHAGVFSRTARIAAVGCIVWLVY